MSWLRQHLDYVMLLKVSIFCAAKLKSEQLELGINYHLWFLRRLGAQIKANEQIQQLE